MFYANPSPDENEEQCCICRNPLIDMSVVEQILSKFNGINVVAKVHTSCINTATPKQIEEAATGALWDTILLSDEVEFFDT